MRISETGLDVLVDTLKRPFTSRGPMGVGFNVVVDPSAKGAKESSDCLRSF